MRVEREQHDAGRPGWGLILGLLAGMIYATGLIAPLTPSEGLPTLAELVIFGALPVALAVLGTVVARSTGVGALLLAEAVGIVAFTLYLLRLQGAF